MLGSGVSIQDFRAWGSLAWCLGLRELDAAIGSSAYSVEGGSRCTPVTGFPELGLRSPKDVRGI